MALPVRDLKSLLDRLGASAAGAVKKADLAKLALAALERSGSGSGALGRS